MITTESIKIITDDLTAIVNRLIDKNKILHLNWVMMGLLGLFLTGCFGEPVFHGTVLPALEPASDFSLTDADGNLISLSDFEDEVVLVYFGYTFCPDVCPATMVELKQAVESLDELGERVQVIMISVDPERDTSQIVQEYVAHFNDDFIGLTGSKDEIDQITSQYGIYYEIHEGTAASGYLVDHTASVLVFDRAGNYRMIYSFDTPSEDIATDLRYLVKE